MMLKARELDALVAERVEDLPVVWEADPFRVPDRRLDPRYPWVKGERDGRTYERTSVKRYATEWGAMRDVVEAMRKHGWSFRLWSGSLEGGEKTYYAAFTPEGETKEGVNPALQMEGRDAPLAVARAALLAITNSA